MKLLLHIQKPLALLLSELHDGDARPLRHNGGYLLLADLARGVSAALLPEPAFALKLVREFILFVANRRCLLKILRIDGARHLLIQGFDFFFKLL